MSATTDPLQTPPAAEPAPSNPEAASPDAVGPDAASPDVVSPAAVSLAIDAPHEPAAPAAPAIPDLSPAACATRLAELFPALFAPPAKPIKLRIQADIQQRAPGLFNKRTLSVFLHRHTTSTPYLRALATAPQRVDLDGNAAGEIAEEHRGAAVAELARRRELHDARRVQERTAQREQQREQQRAAQHEEHKRARAAVQREQAREDQVRRERTALVRAFESSTLTRANFCVLKGISEADLAAQLTLAQQDARQDTQHSTQHATRNTTRDITRDITQADPRQRGTPRPQR